MAGFRIAIYVNGRVPRCWKSESPGLDLVVPVSVSVLGVCPYSGMSITCTGHGISLYKFSVGDDIWVYVRIHLAFGCRGSWA